MGNRAVIETHTRDIGVYLHWNGGPDSVTAFLTYCKLKGYRTPESDNYGWARLCQVVCNFFGGGLCVGVGPCDRLDEDNGDNGTYIIEDWAIVRRTHLRPWMPEHEGYDLLEMLAEINAAQPPAERLPEPFLDPEADDHIAPEDLRPGDYALFADSDESVKGGVVTGEPRENEFGVLLVPVEGAYQGSAFGKSIVRTLSSDATMKAAGGSS